MYYSYLEEVHTALGKPDTEIIRDLNLAAVRLTTVQVTKLPL
jgi:hypothetical protein